MTFPVFAGNAAGSGCYIPTGKKLTKSLRLRASATAYLNRTPASTSNQTTWTWSGWFKRGTTGAYSGLFSAAGGFGTADTNIGFTTSDQLRLQNYDAFSLLTDMITTQVFRDSSSWYHVVVAVDTTQATASDRVKIYVNGTQVTAFDTAVYPTQNSTMYVNSTNAHYVGYFAGFGYTYDGYLAEYNFVDGIQQPVTSFGQFDPVTGVWVPLNYTGAYGTNGFYLPFTDTTSTATLGNDFSGNGNNWTTNNISLTAGSTYDSMTDVPTLTNPQDANYAVLNPLNSGSIVTLSDGNLTTNSTVNWGGMSPTTIGVSSGKWYVEFPIGSPSGAFGASVGLVNAQAPINHDPGYSTNGWAYLYTGQKYTNNTNVAYGASYTTGDVIGIAFDADAGNLTFYKNGVSQGVAYTGLTSGPYFFATAVYSQTFFNAGQQPFAYTPPAGFLPLNTFNLPCPTIWNGANVMSAITYTGQAGTLTITTPGNYEPDLVWIKDRSQVRWHSWFDTIRGPYKRIFSNSNSAETNDVGYNLNSFTSTGFTLLDTDRDTNSAAGDPYVAWCWNAGSGVSSSNTNGSITSTVSVNPTAGFSVVTYSGNSTNNATVGHGLGVAPSFIILKNRSGSYDWPCYHTSLGSSNYIYLNLSAAGVPDANMWKTAPTSTVFTLGTYTENNGSSNNYVAYCWSQIPGYSAFGSYTGNGSTNGPFIYTGFRPRFILIKDTTTAYSWSVLDTSRSPYNGATLDLLPNSSTAEYTVQPTNILSNGFQLAGTDGGLNTNGDTYIYAAFAENPLKFANAR